MSQRKKKTKERRLVKKAKTLNANKGRRECFTRRQETNQDKNK